jgi:type VI secretion system protein ImpH
MPPAQRRQPPAVIAQLLEEPHRFGFFQALRLLERWMRGQEGLSSAQVLGGRIGLRHSLGLAFPASEIAQLDVQRRPAPAGEAAPDIAPGGVPQSREVLRVDITPAFIGLLGAGGALPDYYTEVFAERELYHRDRAGRAFLDIFLHRVGVLFYQAWQKHRLPVQFEADRRNRYLPLVLSLAGIGHAGVRGRLHPKEGGVSDDTLAFFAGAVQRRPMSAAALQRLLAQYFGVPLRVEQFVGRWFSLPEANRAHLGLANMQLGHDFVMGERVWQRDLRLRLHVGPLPRAKFRRFLPGGPAALALNELLGLLTGSTLEYEVQLTLRAQDVGGLTLDEGGAAHLGWDSFLVTDAVTQDRSDVVYELLSA